MAVLLCLPADAAYEVLSDEEKRKIYDRYGEEGLKQQAQQGGQRGGGFGDMFGSFFGGGFGREEETTPKGHDVHADLYVSLKDLYLGREMKVTRVKSVIKTAAGTRQCKCKAKLITKQLGPGAGEENGEEGCWTSKGSVRVERGEDGGEVWVGG
jgi:DnaJ family protein B protein 11